MREFFIFFNKEKGPPSSSPTALLLSCFVTPSSWTTATSPASNTSTWRSYRRKPSATTRWPASWRRSCSQLPSFGALTAEERSFFSVAYKNVAGDRRAAWRMISHIERRKSEGRAALVKNCRDRSESELASICAKMLRILESHLIPSAGSSEAKVFYLKAKGDYHRCIAEFKPGVERKEAVNDSMAAYQAAQAFDAAIAELYSSGRCTYYCSFSMTIIIVGLSLQHLSRSMEHSMDQVLSLGEVVQWLPNSVACFKHAICLLKHYDSNLNQGGSNMNYSDCCDQLKLYS
ncbi:uncharacterized protein [Typha latifolia]|uniref:uncharacterized protein n=1 Tax=Typha latifolia TaxID=4733 RepID=UPI003C30C21C